MRKGYVVIVIVLIRDDQTMKITWLYYLRNLPWYLFFLLIKILPWKVSLWCHDHNILGVGKLAQIKGVDYQTMYDYIFIINRNNYLGKK